MENEAKDQPSAADWVDGIERDWLLQHLVTHANQYPDYEKSITLWVGGGMVTGILVSGSRYFDEYIAEFTSNMSPAGAESTRSVLREIGKSYYEKDPEPIANHTAFIHLIDAKLWTPSGAVPAIQNSGVIWRGRLSQVTGFSLGQIVAGA